MKDAAWVVNPIDAFILQKLEAKGMTPAPPASKRAVLRRVYFDLIGLPPTPEEVREFENNSAPDAYEKVVDKLLADTRYGERWARHWLDLARFAESDGFAIDGERPTAWRYRDYVIRSFNQDKPYDRFVQEQLAGDEMPAADGAKGGGADRSDRLVALGFLRMGTWEADANFKTQLRQDVLNELTGTVGQVFLGVHGRLRPLPRPQVRSDPAARLLSPAGILRAHEDGQSRSAIQRRRGRQQEDARQAADPRRPGR